MQNSKKFNLKKHEISHILNMFVEERIRQDEKWGQKNHTPEFWLAILGEEYEV